MAKKPRSQQRKKGNASLNDAEHEGEKAVEFLPEEHTIADSFTEFSMMDENEDNMEADDILASNMSVLPSDAAQAAAAARLERLKETLLLLEDYTSEKRSARREGTLRGLFRALTHYASGTAGRGLVEEYHELVQNATLHALRVGQAAEQYAACRVLEVSVVVLGSDATYWYDCVQRSLQRVVDSHIKAVPVRVAALRALAMTVFITADSVITEQVMDLCEAVAASEYRNEPVPTPLRATAFDCWALLATTVEDVYLAGQDDVQIGRGLAILPLLRAGLDNGSIELRSAAGECISLIHEARWNITIDDPENTTERKYSRGSWEGSPYEVLMDEVKQRIAELSVESSHYMSKKAKKEQRATFREFQATIVDDESPEEVVNFRNGSLELNTWREIIQLNFVRHCLQGGFQLQLLTNQTLQEIFGVDGAALGSSGAMSQLEKRLIMSKTSGAAKQADLDLNKRRQKRQNIKDHFLTVDGDFI